jgi:hypothetical protein
MNLFASKNARVIAIVDLNFGDNGKGKLGDALACYADWSCAVPAERMRDIRSS